MYKLEDFRKLVQDYGHVADFVVVYTYEAHATDEWHLNNNEYSIKVHRNIEERLAPARMLHQMALPCPLLVDTMDNMAVAIFRALPERLVVLLSGKVIYEGKRGPRGYHIHEVRDCLNAFT